MQSVVALNTIGIFLRAQNLPALPNFITNNRYDSFVVIYMKTVSTGTTEVVVNSRNPSWTKFFMLEYKFQERQQLTFKVFYKNHKFDESILEHHTCIGETTLYLRELVEDSAGYLVRDLKNGKFKASNAKLLIHGENLYDLSPCNLRFEIQATNLIHKGSQKNSSYIAIQRMFESGNWVVVFMNRAQDFATFNFLTWGPASCSLIWLCNYDMRATLKFSVFTHLRDGVNQLVGETDQTCLEEVLARPAGYMYDLYPIPDDPTAMAPTRQSTGQLQILNPTIDSLLPTAVAVVPPSSVPVEVMYPLGTDGALHVTSSRTIIDHFAPLAIDGEVLPPTPPEQQEEAVNSASVLAPPIFQAVNIDVNPSSAVQRLPSIRLESPRLDIGMGSSGLGSRTTSAAVVDTGSTSVNTPKPDEHLESLAEQVMKMSLPRTSSLGTVDQQQDSSTAPAVSTVYDQKDYSSLFAGLVGLHADSEHLPSTFPNFIKCGLEIGMMFAIDYTLSNDHPKGQRKKNDSLHRFDSSSKARAMEAIQNLTEAEEEERDISPTDEEVLTGLNDYQKVIASVGSIVSAYDTDKVFPMMGFGAKPKNNGVVGPVSHCFPLAPDASFLVSGLAGVMEAYCDIQSRIEKSGPTYFQHVLRKCLEFATEKPCTEDSPCYHILTIITDGCINDRNETVDVIVELAKHPVSIIIIGVGETNFDDMIMLDGDDVPLVNSKGETVTRDIVQFVPFNRFVDLGIDELRNEVLAEIPRQVLEYMHNQKIQPKRRAAVPHSTASSSSVAL